MIEAIQLFAQTDLEGRLQRFSETAGLEVVFAAGIGFCGLCFAAMWIRREILVFSFLVLLMFSGSVVEVLDSGSTLLRWGLIGSLSCSAFFFGFKLPGLPGRFLGLYSIWMLGSVSWSENKAFGFQFAVLLVAMTVLMSGHLTKYFERRQSALEIPKLYLFVSIVFISIVFANFDEFRDGKRFSGGIKNSGLFVVNAGLLLPVYLWGILGAKRTASFGWLLIGFITIFGLCVFSAQRTGFFAGLIGCSAFLLLLKPKQVFTIVFMFLASIALGFWLLSFFPVKEEFVFRRFFSTDVTHRDEAWEVTIAFISENPIMGYGCGSANLLPYGVHNAYLYIWYEGGIFALAFFVFALISMGIKSFRLLVDRSSPNKIKMLGTLLLGWTLTLSAASFFESKLASGSNVMIFTLVISSVILNAIETEKAGFLAKMQSNRL